MGAYSKGGGLLEGWLIREFTVLERSILTFRVFPRNLPWKGEVGLTFPYKNWRGRQVWRRRVVNSKACTIKL